MFFGVASPASWNELWQGEQAAFRRSPTFRSEPGAIAAWLRKGELEAHKIACPEYDPGRFKQALRDVRALTRHLPRDFPSIVVRNCGAAGVRVVFVPELPGTRAWGATKWLTQTRPL